jgi:hypothetical protein
MALLSYTPQGKRPGSLQKINLERRFMITKISISKRITAGATILSAVCFAFSANAVTAITFNGLSGTNGALFSSPYTEGTFIVTPTAGTWQEAHLFGHPVPDIFGNSASATIKVTETASRLFLFSSVDFADAGSGGATYSIQGLLNNSTVFSFNGGPVPGSFVTIANQNSLQQIDTLFITMNRSRSTYNIDNIALQEVPEPATFALAGFSLMGLMLCRPRK